jgi:hypothetical protein
MSRARGTFVARRHSGQSVLASSGRRSGLIQPDAGNSPVCRAFSLAISSFQTREERLEEAQKRPGEGAILRKSSTTQG